MRGTVPSGVVLPLHRHADLEIFYVLNGSLEVFEAGGPSAGWQTVNAGGVVSIPGNVRHALRNTSHSPITSITMQAGTLQLLPRARTAIRPDQASSTANSG